MTPLAVKCFVGLLVALPGPTGRLSHFNGYFSGYQVAEKGDMWLVDISGALKRAHIKPVGPQVVWLNGNLCTYVHNPAK